MYLVLVGMTGQTALFSTYGRSNVTVVSHAEGAKAFQGVFSLLLMPYRRAEAWGFQAQDIEATGSLCMERCATQHQQPHMNPDIGTIMWSDVCHNHLY